MTEEKQVRGFLALATLKATGRHDKRSTHCADMLLFGGGRARLHFGVQTTTPLPTAPGTYAVKGLHEEQGHIFVTEITSL